jgi:hypothetical protein
MKRAGKRRRAMIRKEQEMKKVMKECKARKEKIC